MLRVRFGEGSADYLTLSGLHLRPLGVQLRVQDFCTKHWPLRLD